MAEPKKNIDETEYLKAKAQQKEVIIGTDRVMKELKAKKINQIFIASNCPRKTKEDLTYYAQLASVPIVELKQTNEEVGLLCKKNFMVSVVGIIGA